MRKERDLGQIIARSTAFVEREKVERPLYGISRIGGDVPLQRYKQMASVLPSSGLILPEMITSEDFLEDMDRLVFEHERVEGDLFFPLAPLNQFPWMEAIIGCPINISSGMFWAASCGCDLEQLDEVDLSERNAWLQKLLELQVALAEHFKEYPIGTSAMMRGPGDMMGAAIGQERLALALYDSLGKVKSLASRDTEIWLEVAKVQNRLTPLFHGGYLLGGWSGLWMPGMCQYMQEDALSYLSPQFYRKVLLEHHRTMSMSAKYSFFHLHPTSFYAVDELVQLENLNIIEVHREMAGPSIEEMLPTLKKIHEHKALFISWCHGTPSIVSIEAEIRCVLKHLSPGGLCLHFIPEDVEEGKILINLVDKVIKDIKSKL